MISWIQHHLIRHGRWIFLSLLALIIVAFVFTIGNTPGCTTDQSGYQKQLFYGVDLNAPRERDVIVQKVQLSSFLNSQQIRSEAQFQSQLTNRIALLHLADEIGIPSPSQETLRSYITSKNAFRGADGEFSPDAYTSFVDNIESDPSIPQGRVLVVLEEDYRINQIGAALSGPGYVLPSEALSQTRRNRTQFKLDTASINYASFTPEINLEESALRAYYEANQTRYEIPERIKASYVEFKTERFEAPQAETDEASLREHFIANRSQFVADYEAANPEAEEAATFENVRDAVATDFQNQQKNRAANEAAQAFAYTLYRDSIKRDSAAFNELLNKSEVSLTEIEPYTLAGARQRALSTELLESAFKLGGNRYYSDAHPIDGGYAVLIYEGRIDPEIPAFESVQAEVTADYTANEKRRLFNENGERLQTELKDKIAAGADFATAAQELELEVQTYESFTPQTPPSELNSSALQQAQRMQAGEVSPMLTSGGTGIFVHLESKEVPEIASDDSELSQSEEYLARFSAYISGAAYANELVGRGLPEASIEE